MPKYEVEVRFRVRSTYLVAADNEEAAIEEASRRCIAGDNGIVNPNWEWDYEDVWPLDGPAQQAGGDQ